MRPGDEAMIATFNRSMKVRVPFTRDPVQIEQMLDSIAGESAMGTSNTSERKQVQDRIKETTNYDEALASARTYAQSVEHDLRQSAESLNGLMTTLAGVEGKEDPRPGQRRLSDAARPRDVPVHRRSRRTRRAGDSAERSSKA